MFKEQMLLLPLDEDGEAVSGITIICSPGGAEITHFFDGKGAAICPCDGSRLHIDGSIKGGINFYIDSLGFVCIGFTVQSSF